MLGTSFKTKRHMKRLSLLVVIAVLVHQTCSSFCAGLTDGVENGVREVAIDNTDASVVEVIDRPNERQPQYESLWNKVQSELVEQQFGLHSKNSINDHKQARSSSTADLWPIRWIAFLDDSWLDEFLMQCERDPVFKAGITQNLSAMQAFVAFVSIGYAVVATWLGPIKLTRWQRRSVLVTYTAAAIAQAIFLAHAFSIMSIQYAYPSTLALAVVFFVTFNVTNALLVLESEEPEGTVEVPVQQIIESSPTRAVTAQRAARF